ncbi:hypothetical protein [uncultured Sunxiuqinia sp.]|uniref:hypothetical protein n=1 Tax=uncultured Sunxiuqinia sp. TaxID=1573825 RepID=UPI0030D6E52A
MDRKQIENLLNNCSLPDSCQRAELKETHISWIILTDHYAFKIKRPVAFSFLDFTSLEKRKFFCKEELRLNRRLAPDVYQEVISITRNMLEQTEDQQEEVVDYAVKMKRMDSRMEMSKLLREDKVTEKQVDRLAKKTADFHRKEEPIKNAFRTIEFQENYEDIQSLASFAAEQIGEECKHIIRWATKKSWDYLNNSRSLLNERIISGFHKDCHGDLNSRNIFLYDDPVIFDCIEFNKNFRQIDVLNDIAFLAVDFDFFGRKELGELFYKKYLNFSNTEEQPATRELFNFYKSYRANVRAKVSLLAAQKKGEGKNQDELHEALKYLHLMERYLENIE